MPTEPRTILDTIRRFVRREPFVPFAIVMTSGDRYVIEDSFALAIGEAQMHYYPPGSKKMIHMRTNQVAAVEEMDERPAA